MIYWSLFASTIFNEMQNVRVTVTYSIIIISFWTNESVNSLNTKIIKDLKNEFFQNKTLSF